MNRVLGVVALAAYGSVVRTFGARPGREQSRMDRGLTVSEVSAVARARHALRRVEFVETFRIAPSSKLSEAGWIVTPHGSGVPATRPSASGRRREWSATGRAREP